MNSGHIQPPGNDAPAGCPFSGARTQHEGSHVPGDAGDAASWHNAQLDFSKSMSYGDYLSLQSIPVSYTHLTLPTM